MPIQANIALQVQPPQHQNLIGRLSDLTALENAQQQGEVNRLNLDNAKAQQGMANLKLLSQVANDMKNMPQQERKSRADRLAAAFDSSGNTGIATLLRNYEWTDQDANDLAALTRDADAEWKAATERFGAMQGSPTQEMTMPGVAPEPIEAPGVMLSEQPTPPSRTIEMPMPEVQFPARDGQPAFAMRPPSGQQIARTTRAHAIQTAEDRSAIEAAYREPQQPSAYLQGYFQAKQERPGLTRAQYDKEQSDLNRAPQMGWTRDASGRETYGPLGTGAVRERLPLRDIGGLPPQAQTRVQSIASQFDTNPTVRNFNESIMRYDGLRRLLTLPWSGPQDMATVFEFMRSLDPTSVVRESEYAEARKTGNIFSGWAARFNGLFNAEGGFLSEQVKKDFVSVLGERLKASSEQVQNIYKDFGRRIDIVTGKPGTGIEYLTNYTTMLPPIGDGAPNSETITGASTRGVPASDFQVGEIVEQDGKRFRVTSVNPLQGEPVP